MRAPYLILLCLLALLLWAAPAHAARSYQNCTGTITTLPATISQSGTWCLKQNLSTSMTTGMAITVNADDVTIDCNDFQLNGLAAGPGTNADGIFSDNFSNVTVRNCDVRGFYTGIELYTAFDATHGNLAENNHLDGNTALALWVMGRGSVARNNVVIDTGGSTFAFSPTGIRAGYSVDVLDNVVSGVVATAGGNGSAAGIWEDVDGGNPTGSSAAINRNVVNGVHADGTSPSIGISVSSYDIPSRMSVRDNEVTGDGSTPSIAILCVDSRIRVRNNSISGFGTGMQTCGDAGDNDIKH